MGIGKIYVVYFVFDFKLDLNALMNSIYVYIYPVVTPH